MTSFTTGGGFCMMVRGTHPVFGEVSGSLSERSKRRNLHLRKRTAKERSASTPRNGKGETKLDASRNCQVPNTAPFSSQGKKTSKKPER